ncbi:MAG: DUF2842 domain-containing protein [Rhizobiaceae bacterium]
MPYQARKLVGTVLLVALVVIYAMAAVTVASARLANSEPWVHLVYFLVSGLLWVLPAMALIKWMAGPRPPRQD